MAARALIAIMMAVVFYTYFGYGLLIWLWLKIRKLKN